MEVVRAHSSAAEQGAHNLLVVGSNPTGPTNGFKMAEMPFLLFKDTKVFIKPNLFSAEEPLPDMLSYFRHLLVLYSEFV